MMPLYCLVDEDRCHDGDVVIFLICWFVDGDVNVCFRAYSYDASSSLADK